MSEELKEKEKVQANVVFGQGSAIAVTGIIGGVVLALGFPWIVLAYGQPLGATLVVIFVLSGLVLGGLVALTSAFFGLVIPRASGWHQSHLVGPRRLESLVPGLGRSGRCGLERLDRFRLESLG